MTIFALILLLALPVQAEWLPAVQPIDVELQADHYTVAGPTNGPCELSVGKELANGLTVEAWIQAENQAGCIAEMTKGRDTLWQLNRIADGTLAAMVGTQTVWQTTALLPAKERHHVAITFRREIIPSVMVNVFVDGANAGRAFFPARHALVGTTLRLGQLPGTYARGQVSRVARDFYPPAKLKPGRDEIRLDGRTAAMSVTRPVELPAVGQVEFRVQPLDWDNHCARPDNDKTDWVDKVVPLVELLGRDEQVLASWSVDRSVDSFGELPDFRPGQWTTVLLTFHTNRVAVYFDGQYVFPGNRRGLKFEKKMANWTPTAIRFNSGRVRTIVADLKISPDRQPLPKRESQVPKWAGTTAGLFATVPAPWTPLEVRDHSIRCWSTKFTIGPGGWLAGCVTRGRELLAGPVRLIAETETGPLTLAGAIPSLTRIGETGVTWSGQLSSPTLEARLTCALEFDGMIKHELTLIPRGEVALRRLTVDIPLSSEVVPLYHSMSLGSVGSAAGEWSAGEGRIWDSATAYKTGKWRKVLAVGSFVPMIWTGSEERGLCWFADNDRGWFPDNAVPAIEVIRQGEVLTLRLNLAGAPVKFDQPRTIVFGLIPTPTKPLPVDWRAWQRGGTTNNPIVGNVAGCFDTSMGAAVENFAVYPIRGWDWAEEVGRRRREATRGRSANMLYMSAYWIGERYADWAAHAPEWEGSAENRAFFTPSYVEYLASEFDQWFGRGILDGVYVDEVYPTYSTKPELGGAYLLPDGRVQPGGSLFQEREFFKRLHGLSLAHGKQPIIIHHVSDTMLPPLVSFATLTLDGESNHTTRNHVSQWIKPAGPDFMDVWPLERIRAMDLGAGGGNIPLWLPMLDEKERDPVWRRAATRTMLATILLHDLWFMFDRYDSAFVNQFVAPALRSFDIAAPDVSFTGYWQQPVRTPANIKVSVYRQPGRALLVVSNFAHEPVTATIAWPGVKSAACLENRYAAQAGPKLKLDYQSAVEPAVAGGIISVPVAGRDYRLVVLETE